MAPNGYTKMTSAQTAVTQYVEAANGVHYAYRRIGPKHGTPLVLHIYFRANMDLWDPSLINTLATARPVLIFDQPGVGRTRGEVPTSYQGWANDLITFVEALDLKQIDLLGFSMGGVAAQMVALTAPHLVRKLVLAGTTASLPSAEFIAGIVWPRERSPMEVIMQLRNAVTIEEGKAAIAQSFFLVDDPGQAAADAYWKRISSRTAEPVMLELLDSEDGAKRQWAAVLEIFKPNPRNSFDRLGELKMPVLVANGDSDMLIPPSRSWELYHQIENAQLIMYPKSGHGFLWQYPDLFARHVSAFLDGPEYDGLVVKL